MKRKSALTLLISAFVTACILWACSSRPPEPQFPKTPPPEEKVGRVLRVSPDEAHQRVRAGKALLVCAYESEETCKSIHLAESIFLGEFKSRLVSMPKDQEIIFYCA